MEAAKLFASHSKTPTRIATIEIDVEKIPIIDLTDANMRAKFLSSEKSKNYANKFQEVLIKGSIPKECVKDVEDQF